MNAQRENEKNVLHNTQQWTMERSDQIYYQRKEFQQFENKCDNNINVNNAWLELTQRTGQL